MSLVSLSDVTFRFPGAGVDVIEKINLYLDPEEILWVKGRNGSGKSTLLKIVSGLLRPTSGTKIYAPGATATYMNQNASDMLALGLTVEEQLRAAAVRGGLSFQTLQDYLAQFELGLEERSREFVGHLSGGQKQVLALLCSLANGSRILCLDEFTAALDPLTRSRAEAMVASLTVDQGFGVLLVTHDEHSDLGTRTFNLEKNEIDR